MKILTVGVFDYFHYGHLKLFQRAKALGEYLIVAVQEDEAVTKFKPNSKLLYSLEKRKEIVGAIRYVDEVISYSNVYELVCKTNFDILVLGEDQNHEWFQKAKLYCLKNGKQVTVLPRTPGICSSNIKAEFLK